MFSTFFFFFIIITIETSLNKKFKYKYCLYFYFQIIIFTIFKQICYNPYQQSGLFKKKIRVFKLVDNIKHRMKPGKGR